MGSFIQGYKWKWQVNTGTSSSPTWTEIGGQTEGGLNPFECDYEDVTTKDDEGWKRQEPTLATWAGKLSINYKRTDPGIAELEEAARTRNSVQLRFVEDNGEYYEMEAFVKWGITAGQTGIVKVEVTLTPAGPCYHYAAT